MFCSLNNLTKLDENVNHLAKRLSNFPRKSEHLYRDIQICAKMDTAANFMQTKSIDCLYDVPHLLLFVSNPRAGDQNQVYEVANKQNEH